MSKPEALSRREVISVAGATGLTYIIIACLWIAFSDTLLVWMFPRADKDTMAFLQTLKGWGFVLITGLLFTLILYRRLMEISNTQHSLQEHMESYRMLFEHNPLPMWIYDPATLRFVEVNEAAIHTYGYSREEFLAMTPTDLRPAEDRQEFTRMLSATSGLRVEGTWRHVWKNGSIRHVQIASDPITFLGRTLRLTLANDITERYRAEEELRRSERQFRSVLDNSIDVIYELNPATGRYNYVSPSALRVLSIAADDLMNAGPDLMNMCIAEEDREAVHRHFRELMLFAGGEHTIPAVEYRFHPPGGGECWLQETSSVVCDSSGENSVIVGTIRDVTVRRQSEHAIRRMNEELEKRVHERTLQLRMSNTELEAFSYSVSHDLRAPLRSIGGFSKILMTDYADRLDERGLDYLHRIQAAGQRMNMLISALLDLSHVTRTEISRTRVDLSSMATAIFDDLRSTQPERSAELRVAPGLTVWADTNMMHAVLENLLGNAWKFTAQRPQAMIEFFSQQEQDHTVYCIRDNGVGFDMEYAGKLFIPFQRLHSAKEFQGTGIGLATVQRIISRHGGRVWAESAVDQGTTFYFTLTV